MNSKTYLIFIVCSGLVLGGCGNSGGNNAGGSGVTPVTPEPENALAVFGRLAADDEPLAISTQLENDIQAVFGDADNTTTDVIAGDTAQTVIDRAELN